MHNKLGWEQPRFATDLADVDMPFVFGLDRLRALPNLLFTIKKAHFDFLHN